MKVFVDRIGLSGSPFCRLLWGGGDHQAFHDVPVKAAASYVFMVATWGGYIFVINAIGVHALLLVGLGRFNSGVYKAFWVFKRSDLFQSDVESHLAV